MLRQKRKRNICSFVGTDASRLLWIEGTVTLTGYVHDQRNMLHMQSRTMPFHLCDDQ